MTRDDLPKRLTGKTAAVTADSIADGIRCNCVCPGVIDSPSLRGRIAELAETLGSEAEARRFYIDRQPSGRFGTPEEVAALCAFPASDDGAFVNGQAINVDGGITI